MYDKQWKSKYLSKSQTIANIYVDEEIFQFNEHDGMRVAYLIESMAIKPGLYVNFSLNIDYITSQYDMILSHSRGIVKRNSNAFWAPASQIWIDNPKIKQKNKLASMISSAKVMCDGHAKRLEWVDRLMGKLDIFGSGINPIEKKEHGLDDYMFSVAIENDTYAGYFTEKILDCFATGTVPIYLGDPEISSVFNPDGIIFLDDNFNINDLNEDIYYEMMPAIIENFKICKQFSSIDEYIYKNYLMQRSKI